jgi:hypothetical protein
LEITLALLERQTCSREGAPAAGAAAEKVWLDEHSLRVAGIARFNISP